MEEDRSGAGPGDDARDIYLKKSAKAAKQARKQRSQAGKMRQRARATQGERREALTADRVNAPWRHYLREWRLERGLRLKDLSDATGINKDMISRYERFERGLSIDNQYRLIAALKISPAEFFHDPKSDVAALIRATETSSPEIQQRMLAAIRELQRRI